MSTFYLLVNAGGDRLLADAGGTYLAYQTGSSEGTTYTLTPTFDTAAINLPGDVEVWYNKRGESFPFSRTGGFNPEEASWANNVLTLTNYTGSDTVYAALYYSDGTRVTNESGTALSSVNVTLG